MTCTTLYTYIIFTYMQYIPMSRIFLDAVVLIWDAPLDVTPARLDWSEGSSRQSPVLGWGERPTLRLLASTCFNREFICM